MKFYTFAMPAVVHAGPGAILELSSLIKGLGASRPLIMTDSILYGAGVASRVEKAVPGSMVYKEIKPDPSSQQIVEALKILKDSDADVIIAVGGGSVIDVAKLSSILLNNKNDLAVYAENWDLIDKPGLPLITIPTTIGSGSEMTRGAVFVDTESHAKKVIVSNYLAARACILDPELLNTLPASVAAATGADALTQAIEGVVSLNSTAFTDALHLNAIRLIRDALKPAVMDRSNVEAMGNMQEAAAMVGAAMAYSGVGAVHAIANTLGGHFHIPHGVACAIMLLPVLEYNAHTAAPRYRLIAEALNLDTKGYTDDEVADFVIRYVRQLMNDIGFNRKLSEFEITEKDVKWLAVESHGHSDMVSNPRKPTVEEVETLIQAAL